MDSDSMASFTEEEENPESDKEAEPDKAPA